MKRLNRRPWFSSMNFQFYVGNPDVLNVIYFKFSNFLFSSIISSENELK